MMPRLRSVLALGLACLIALTAVHVGMIRGQAKVAGSIVICSGGGAVNVAVDTDGNPVGPLHECPDCVVSVLAALDLPAVNPVHAPQPATALWAEPSTAARSLVALTANARGPPLAS